MSKLVLKDAATLRGSSTSTQVAGSIPQLGSPKYGMVTAGGSYNKAVDEIASLFGLPAGPIAPGWELAQFLPVELERDEDGTYIASDAMLLIYGSGESWREALEDYISALIEYYQLVEEGAERGSENDRRELRRVRGYVRPVSQ